MEQIFEVDIKRGAELLRYRLGVRWERGNGELAEELSIDGRHLYRARSGKAEFYGDVPSAKPRTTIPFDRRRSFIAALEPRPDNRRTISFRDSIRSIWAIKPDPCRIAGHTGKESQFLARDLSNFAAWYLAKVTENPDAAAALREDLTRALPGFSSLRFEPASSEVKDLLVRFFFAGKTH